MTIKWIAIVGSRKFPVASLHIIRDFVYDLSQISKGFVIVSGGAEGVDTTAVKAAKEFGMADPQEFLPNYDLYGRYEAPKKRNIEIVDFSDVVYAFQYRKSGGTKHVTDYAREKGKLKHIFEYE